MTTFKQARDYGYPTRFTVSRSQYGITGRPTCQTYRGTWAKWRERNTGHYNEAIRYVRGGYLDRVPEIVGNGDCVIEFMPDHSAFVDRLRRMDEPVPFWEPARYAYEDFKASIERAIRKLNEGGGTVNG